MQKNIKVDIQEYYACWRELNRIYSCWADKYGLSLLALYVLYALSEVESGCTQKRICERWIIPKQTVNSILKGFEAEGYILYRPMEHDRRNKEILLTLVGKDYADKVIGSLTVIEERVMMRMGEESRKAMNAGSHLFCEYFNEETSNNGQKQAFE